MKIFKNIPFLIVAALAWVVIISSCANQGMPTGGPQDSIPPLIVNTSPDYKARNFDEDAVEITFNEFIDITDVREQLVVSPPLEERPTVRTRSRTLIVQFNEELEDSTTYSLDFKNSVVDNNEGNPYENLRFLFSTGETIDSLRVAGRVMEAFNLEPKANTLVMLQSNLHDSAVYTVIPDYIARTDENGLFLMDNVAPDTYNIFSITDLNNDLLYNEGAEPIAFIDTLVIPRAEYVAAPDTLVSGADSMLIAGHTVFYPEPFYLRQFDEDLFEQYLKRYERNSRTKATFVFNESVADTFGVRLLNRNYAVEWYLKEQNENVDSLIYWITDPQALQSDTLLTELSYYQLDDFQQLYVQKDTVELIYTGDDKETNRGRDGEEEEQEPVEQFSFSSNVGNSPFNLNQDILLTSSSPIDTIYEERIHLMLREDTLQIPMNFSFTKDTTAWRLYRLSHDWEPASDYRLQIDSAAAIDIYGVTNEELTRNFTTRPTDYYGTLNLILNNVTEPMIIQLLENNDDETVIEERYITEDETVVFGYLAPVKYKIKAIYDSNANGVWNTGSYQDKSLPERVVYINEVVSIRSNFDSNLVWDLIPDPEFYKNIRDRELEEQQRREEEEQEREQLENQQRQQNNFLQQNRGLGGFDVIRE